MTPAEIRLEVYKLCESFGNATQTRDKLVIESVAVVVHAKVLELIPDAPEPETVTGPTNHL